MPITPQQHRVLGFVQNYIESKGYSPTQMEIAKKFNLSSLGTVQKHLKGLETKGYLTKAWNGKRAIQLNEVRATAVRIPMSGIVAAGRPIEAIEQNETFEVPSALLRGGENFGLTVKGESIARRVGIEPCAPCCKCHSGNMCRVAAESKSSVLRATNSNDSEISRCVRAC